ncbi:hypothetical protein EAH79_16195 [Sphingomonas koreensis]|nr:hypothetical protein EAH79_16195 [Sphingomonas koreensis]
MLLLEGRIIAVANGKAHPDATMIERLDLTDGDERRDGDTLHVGAWGMNRLIQHLWQRPSHQSSKALGSRLASLFPGAMLWSEMGRATVRSMLGLPHVGGDTSLWLAAAQRQLAWQPDGPIEIKHHRDW